MNSGDTVDMGSLTEPSKYNGHFKSKCVCANWYVTTVLLMVFNAFKDMLFRKTCFLENSIKSEAYSHCNFMCWSVSDILSFFFFLKILIPCTQSMRK